MCSNKLRACALIFALATSSCSACDNFFERPDYARCSNSSGSDWEIIPDEFRRFKRTLPTQKNRCLVYNGELTVDLISMNVDGTICNACDSEIEFTSATLNNTPIVKSTLQLDERQYATCLSGAGEPTPEAILSEQTIESGETIGASGGFLYRGGFTKVTDRSLTRGNEFQVFWPSLGSGDLALQARCLGGSPLNDSVFVQVVDEPFSEPVLNFLKEMIVRD